MTENHSLVARPKGVAVAYPVGYAGIYRYKDNVWMHSYAEYVKQVVK